MTVGQINTTVHSWRGTLNSNGNRDATTVGMNMDQPHTHTRDVGKPETIKRMGSEAKKVGSKVGRTEEGQ